MSRLRTENLGLRAGDDRGRVLCRELNVAFEPGQNWAILGPNGSGKTTLLHTLAGLRAPASGGVRLDDRPIQEYSHRQRARRLGVLFQHSEQVFPETVWERVLSGRHPFHPHPWWPFRGGESAEDRRQAAAALENVGLEGLEGRLLNTLSGGERRRVEIATLLTQDPPLCLLDEPNNDLDLNYQTRILARIGQRVRHGGRLNILVLHDVNMALRFCEYGILLFGDGRHRHGRLRDIIDTSSLEALYQCPFRRLDDRDRPVFLPA